MSGSVSIVGNLQWYMIYAYYTRSLFVMFIPLFAASFFTSRDDRQTACRWNASTLEKEAQAMFVDCPLPLWQPQTFPAVKPMEKNLAGFHLYKQKVPGSQPIRSSSRGRVVFFDKAKTDRNESGRWMISCTQRLQKLRKKMDVSDLINGWATLHGTGVHIFTHMNSWLFSW